ncbi:MAG: RES family NAD+ phosphorylase, partial [Rhodopirellula sp. JB044]|uniref:RES family NAD+ phosphorylase n=1 Tax=Rhodopirellula sp. JB044 TaxID=3342844 RepID=UPI00370BC1BC
RKPAFYAATSELTAIKETRPWIGALISVGYFETVRPLKLVNLVDAYMGEKKSFVFLLNRLHKKLNEENAEQFAWHFIGEAFSRPVTLDDDPKGYLPTQILAELFKSAGVDGIAFRSSVEVSQVDKEADDEPVEFNIVLFNLDDVKQVGGHVSKVTGFDITIDHGPHY